MKNDDALQEGLALAARAAGFEITWNVEFQYAEFNATRIPWSPNLDDADSRKLANAIEISVLIEADNVKAMSHLHAIGYEVPRRKGEGDLDAEVRAAVLQVAMRIGNEMPNTLH